jgi:tetratricopeptide (TPR) repeat protein
VQLVEAFWRGGGKYLVVGALIVFGLVWGVRKASHGIDRATEEEKKVHDVAIKIAEARARAIVNPVAARQDEADLRRMGDPDFDRGVELAAAGHHDEAAEAFAAYISASPGRPTAATAQFLRAKSLLAAQKPDAAAAELESFLARNPGHADAAEARVMHAEALFAAHRFQQAIDAATAAFTESDASELSIRARVVRARASLELGARDDARRDAQFVKDHVSALAPGYKAAIELLSQCGVPPDPDPRPNE